AVGVAAVGVAAGIAPACPGVRARLPGAIVGGELAPDRWAALEAVVVGEAQLLQEGRRLRLRDVGRAGRDHGDREAHAVLGEPDAGEAVTEDLRLGVVVLHLLPLGDDDLDVLVAAGVPTLTPRLVPDA